jgi:type IV pilus assembly protein PilC
MKFKVVSVSNSGEKQERILESSDKFGIFSLLKEEGVTPVSVVEEKGGFSFDFQKLNMIVNTVSMREKILFARNLGAMIEAGLPISRALFVIEKQSRNQKFKSILKSVQSSIKHGNNLSSSLSKYPKVFSKIFTAMVKAGEESGSLSESLKVVSTQMEKTYLLKRKIRGALMYPGIILTAMIIIGILMLIYVVPTLTATFKELEIDLPASTRALILISDFLKDHTFIFLFGIFAIVGGLYAWSQDPKGKRSLDYIFLHIPLISNLVRETNSARTARTLSSLLSSGIEVVNALEITKDVVKNSYYKEVLSKAENKIQKGVSLSKIFEEESDIYPIFVSEMVSVGEETGKLSDMFQRVAIFYEEDIDQKTKNMSTIIEPFLMIFIGVVVGFFALSMITPTYSLVGGL